MEDKKMYMYVLFVKTGYEHKLNEQITNVWRIDGLKSYVPMYEFRFRKAGQKIIEKKRWFPGYIFFESAMNGLDFYLTVKPYITRSDYALKLLRYGDENINESFEMKDDESKVLLKLLDDERCVKMSVGLIEGSKIIINTGPLIGFEGLIKRINRHKMEATVELSFFGAIREVTVGLEIISKSP